MKPRLLLVTDLAYEAPGRRYGDEDVQLAGVLRADFDVVLTDPRCAAAFLGDVDVVLVRNIGPPQAVAAELAALRARSAGLRVYNALDGGGDMAGKGYLVTLTDAGHPVIPTADTPARAAALPAAQRYLVKPRDGADSVGLQVLTPAELRERTNLDGLLAQPWLELVDEMSLYYVDDVYSHALHTPDPVQRWALEPYAPTADELAVAQRFASWNPLSHGVQRVDLCRTRDGDVRLVELEDLDPFLSLDRLDADVRVAFTGLLVAALHRLLAA